MFYRRNMQSTIMEQEIKQNEVKIGFNLRGISNVI